MTTELSCLFVQALQQPADGVAAPGVGTLMVIVVPLIQQMIVEGKAAEGGGHELKVRLQPLGPDVTRCTGGRPVECCSAALIVDILHQSQPDLRKPHPEARMCSMSLGKQ